MITQEFTTSNGDYIAVMLPDDATDVTINQSVLAFGSKEQDPLGVGGDLISLPGAQYEMIGQVSSLKEKDWQDFVGLAVGEDRWYSTPKHSSLTLLFNHEVYTKRPYDEGCQFNTPPYCTWCGGHEHLCEEHKEWERMQARTGNWYLLKKIK